MLKRLITFLVGHLRIEVRGGRLERFLNLALEAELYLWNIQRQGDRMRVSLTISDFFALRPVARGSRSRVRILGRYGFPFVVQRLKGRPVLLAGAAICLGFIFWASSHVWIVKVNVTGPQNLDRRAVEAVAAEAGLRPGVVKRRVDLVKVQDHIQKRMGEISWVGIRLQGTRAVIEVVEKASSHPPNMAGCVNLVARRSGVIEQVIPFQGEPKVKKGDVVKPGDLLVECSFRYWQGGRPMVYPGTPLPERESTARTVVAQAIVRARIAHHQYKEVPLVQKVEELTGRTAVQWVLKWKDRSIILRGKNGIPFEQYREQRRAYTLGSWRNWKPPVELVLVNAAEIEVREERIPIATAVEQVREQLAEQLRWWLGPSDKLLSPIKARVVEEGKDYVGIEVTAETQEEIASPVEGVPVPLKPEPLPNNAPQR